MKYVDFRARYVVILYAHRVKKPEKVGSSVRMCVFRVTFDPRCSIILHLPACIP
jgi:hypothetical protein